MSTVTVPIAFTETARTLIRHAEHENWTPERFEVLFGEGAMEGLSRERLRIITSVTTLYGLPMSFPEEPGPRPFIIEIKLFSKGAVAQVGVHVELVEASY